MPLFLFLSARYFLLWLPWLPLCLSFSCLDRASSLPPPRSCWEKEGGGMNEWSLLSLRIWLQNTQWYTYFELNWRYNKLSLQLVLSCPTRHCGLELLYPTPPAVLSLLKAGVLNIKLFNYMILYAVGPAPSDRKCGSEHQTRFFLFGRVWRWDSCLN